MQTMAESKVRMESSTNDKELIVITISVLHTVASNLLSGQGQPQIMVPPLSPRYREHKYVPAYLLDL